MLYSQLVPIIRALEIRWQTSLKGNPDPRMANNQIQFFSVEAAPPPYEGDLPIVIGIGANYAQEKASSHIWREPYIKGPQGQICVEDKTSPSPMRKHLDATFRAYDADRPAWVDRCIASSAQIPIPKGYILIATNFCPFITYESWAKYKEQYRANLLKHSRFGFPHLDSLLLALSQEGVNVHLFVGHYLECEVPTLFRMWVERNALEPWMLTRNLGWPLQTSPNCFHKAPPPAAPTVDRSDLTNFNE